MIRPILQRGHWMLTQPSATVEDPAAVATVIQDLWDTLRYVQGEYDFTRGSGITAVQIGSLVRVSAIDFGGGEQYTILNSELVAIDDTPIGVPEGCLSFFQERGVARRLADVSLRGIGGNGDPLVIQSHGDPDRTSLLQHEYDHGAGRLYVATMLPGESLVHYPEKPSFAS